ncbi:MAG: valine--tRNA ligase, partial [Cellvibrionales bacterium]|nr:valine--tRNA ligase [Cellvibrionales bacterium]
KAVIVAVRNIRGEMNISPAKALPVFFNHGSEQDKTRLANGQPLIQTLAKVESITWLDANDEAPAAATQLVGELEIMVPLAGFIDKDAEIARLDKEIAKLDKEVGRLSGKLNNSGFIDKAPEDVVAKEQQKLADAKDAQQRLENQKQQLNAL